MYKDTCIYAHFYTSTSYFSTISNSEHTLKNMTNTLMQLQPYIIHISYTKEHNSYMVSSDTPLVVLMWDNKSIPTIYISSTTNVHSPSPYLGLSDSSYIMTTYTEPFYPHKPSLQNIFKSSHAQGLDEN
jgi:hypothetical protein